MAALVLSVAGGAIGSAFGPIGAIAGRLVGALAGNLIDRSLFGPGNQSVEGPRLGELDVLASTEGAPIPRAYGRARLGGQVIWATPLEEVASDSTQPSSGGKGGALSGPTTTTTTYSYFANFAVGLCEGPIARVGRVWADGKPLDLTGVTMRVHTGGDDQLPDDLIVARDGAGNAPAYRGLAYVVFERLALADFGNRIPQLTFEIVRPVGQLETMARAVTLIPGTTEFGYEPATVVATIGPGQSQPENRHVANAPSDVIAALDDLQSVCPNLERVAIVVAWFGSDLRAGQCVVQPGIDNAAKTTSLGSPWSVDGVLRPTAYVVSQSSGRPAFGGTPSDQSIVHLINELKARGLKITLYPFVVMDISAGNNLPDPWSGATSQPAYPWRGRITCDPAPGRPESPQGTSAAADQVAHFFGGGVWNYRRMVLHYASLAASAGGVDAILIGSELKALTRVRSGPGVYPGVSQLVTLAADVKAIVGPGCVVTYGADWTEYGADVVGSGEVRFPLDPLWTSPAIGAVGIDYYAPLADWRDNAGHRDQARAVSTYDRDYLKGNVRGGEAYDWYYPDEAARAAQARTEITDALGKPWVYRVKDIWNWWSQPHVERVGGVEVAAPTAWSPRSKPIWLTEAGCPAVDKGANQPSVFPDPKSSENLRPYFSNDGRDDLIQRRALEAMITAFDPVYGADMTDNPVSPVYGGRMLDVSALHLWTWDSRPFPVFPGALDVWADGANWQTGHWLNGRLGGAPMDALVGALLADCGITGVNTDALLDSCDGYVVDRPMSPRAMIAPLAQAYAFDATTDGDTLAFVSRGGRVVAEIGEDDLALPDRAKPPAMLVRAQETELPRQVSVGFTDILGEYRRSAVTSRKLVGGANRVTKSDLAVITNDAAATRRAEIWLQDLWAGRETAQFGLGMRALALTPGDVVALTLDGRRRLFEIDEIVDTEQRQIKARSIDPEVFALPQSSPRRRSQPIPVALGPVHAEVLDLPTFDASAPTILTRLAVSANPWPGAVTIWHSDDATSFAPLDVATTPATVGVTLDPLAAGPTSRWDRASRCRVRLYGGALTARGDTQVLAGGNLAAIQTAPGVWEVIQFADAELVDGQTFLISRLLRGQGGSDDAIAASVPAGAAFVLLDRSLVPLARGLDALERPMQLRLAATGRSHDDPIAVALTVTPQRTALLPLSPVHLRACRNSDGVHVTWIRRTRIDGDGWNAEVPLGEDTEAYALDILSGSTLKRSIACPTPQAVYANADEIADFGAAQTSLTFRVAQLSASVGAGRTTTRTIAV